jgi:F-box/leucine-rich repeat protein 4
VELICLSKNCPQLEQLDILGSNLVTLDAIELVLRDCKNLKIFDISFCANVDIPSFVRLSQIFPNCSIKKSIQSD